MVAQEQPDVTLALPSIFCQTEERKKKYLLKQQQKTRADRAWSLKQPNVDWWEMSKALRLRTSFVTPAVSFLHLPLKIDKRGILLLISCDISISVSACTQQRKPFLKAWLHT